MEIKVIFQVATSAADNLRGNAGNYGKRLNVLGNHSPSRHYSTFADGHRGQNRGTRCHVRPVPDMNRSAFRSEIWTLRIVANRKNLNVATNINIASDIQAEPAIQKAIIADNRVSVDGDSLRCEKC